MKKLVISIVACHCILDQSLCHKQLFFTVSVLLGYAVSLGVSAWHFKAM